MKPSNKMKKMVKLIEKDLGIKFEGKATSFEDTSEFIERYIDKWKEFKSKQSPSEAQMKGVKFIESALDITYTGRNERGQISEFLDEYLGEAQRKVRTTR